MLSIQQLIKALRQLQNNSNAMTATATTAAAAGDLVKSFKHHVVNGCGAQRTAETTAGQIAAATTATAVDNDVTSAATVRTLSLLVGAITATLPKQQQQQQRASNSSQSDEEIECDSSNGHCGAGKWHRTAAPSALCGVGHKFSLDSCVLANGCVCATQVTVATTADEATTANSTHSKPTPTKQTVPPYTPPPAVQRSEQIQNFYLQQLQHFHTAPQQQQPNLCSKQKQTQFAMSSLAAEPLVLKPDEIAAAANGLSGGRADEHNADAASNGASNSNGIAPTGNCSSSSKPCFNTGLGEILQFMELIGNLKHTKRTGWVLRDVNDCESISGHMYRMSMMTFLLDGSEGLNQIRCMELALVHDLAESLVGDITPFCGVSKTEKRAMEFKAMADICKLIEPRGKRIMELFEEYEQGESAESKFVKDLDRLDMVMQAFEYEKRDNCLLKHQEFFDSTEGKFNHPFVKKLVEEIYEQRRSLAKDKGATPPPPVLVPSMEEQPEATTSNEQLKQKSSSTSS